MTKSVVLGHKPVHSSQISATLMKSNGEAKHKELASVPLALKPMHASDVSITCGHVKEMGSCEREEALQTQTLVPIFGSAVSTSDLHTLCSRRSL